MAEKEKNSRLIENLQFDEYADPSESPKSENNPTPIRKRRSLDTTLKLMEAVAKRNNNK